MDTIYNGMTLPPRLREPRIINKDILSPWLTKCLAKSYQRGVPIHNFAGERVIKLLKFLKLMDDGSFLVSISDSNQSCMAIISHKAISVYERENRCRITQHTTNTLLLIQNTTLKWLSRMQFYTICEDLIPNYPANYFAMLYINDLEVVDHDQDPLNVVLQSVYQDVRYMNVVKPCVVEQDEFETL